MKKAMETFRETGIFDPGYFAHTADATDGSGVITTMFEMTEDDGTLMTYDYRADSITEKPDGPVLYTIDWSEENKLAYTMTVHYRGDRITY